MNKSNPSLSNESTNVQRPELSEDRKDNVNIEGLGIQDNKSNGLQVPLRDGGKVHLESNKDPYHFFNNCSIVEYNRDAVWRCTYGIFVPSAKQYKWIHVL
jgi:hypothetical protein